MSKKILAIKDMVFYAQQKPEALATLIAGLVTDTLTSIAISGADKIAVPESGADAKTEAYTTEALSQYGDEMTATVTLALKEEVEGVSISDGTVSVSDECEADNFTLKATSGSVTAEKTVTLVASN